jgi:hypothetical protein
VEWEAALEASSGAADLINTPISIKIRFVRVMLTLVIAGYWSPHMQILSAVG